MRKVKQYIASLLIFVMTMSMCLTAFADDPAPAPTSGSITIENTSQGETYDVYKIFDLTYAEDKTTTNDEYNGKVTSPVSYTFSGNPTQAGILNGDGSPFIAEKSTVDGVYNISLKEGKAAQDIVTFFSENDDANLKALGTKVNTEAVKGNGASQTVSNLAYGYYYIKSSLGSMVTIDSTLPNVTVVDKNEKTPSWDNDPEDGNNPDKPGPGKVILIPNGNGTYKKATESTANYGDTVKFSIAVNAKALVGTKLVTYYYIKDELGAGFEFTDPLEIDVNIYPVVATEIDGEQAYVYSDTPTDVTEGEDYILGVDTENNEFAVEIPFGLKYGSEAKIEVTYSAKVKNTDQVVLGPEGNPNDAWFMYDTDENYDPDPDSPDHYDPNPDNDDPENPEYPVPDQPMNPEDPDPDDVQPGEDDPKAETKTYVYAIDLLKYTGPATAKTPLAGAKFELTDADGNKVPLAGDTEVSESSGYEYKEGATQPELVTLDDGKIIIKGLKEGTYTLTETEAPSGYNKLTTPITVTLNKQNSNSDFDNTDNLAVPVEVENMTGAELPSTGGRGTTLLLVFGSIIALMTGIVLVTKKRMYNEG